MADRRTITRLLVDWGNGNENALDHLTPLVYGELHALARAYLGRNRGQTLQPTELIGELYLRLIDQSTPVQWENRSHFFGIAARLMRLVLVDHARARRAAKRGGDANRVTLNETLALSPGRAPDVLEVDEALSRLAGVDERKAQVIELRYFGGMNREEIAAALRLTVSTVKRDLRLGEAWLRRSLTGPASQPA
ncbi:MAG TPA: ECF-type sigma factor [Thermoanaerobaculia bacterium]|nr:ECF-type sigma factor [Thermoanaerobaculia bacterium]